MGAGSRGFGVRFVDRGGVGGWLVGGSEIVTRDGAGGFGVCDGVGVLDGVGRFGGPAGALGCAGTTT